MVISGHSAVMESGQMVNAFTAEPIPVMLASASAPSGNPYEAGKAAAQAAAGSNQN
jgi:hypothetical protein